MNKRPKTYKLGPVEKAIMRAKWGKSALKAHLQALTGEDWKTVVEQVAVLVFIIGLAADIDRVPDTDPDLRILAGTANTLMETAHYETLTDMVRGSLSAGVMAVERMAPRMSDKAMIQASQTVQLLMKQGGVYGHHFQEVFNR